MAERLPRDVGHHVVEEAIGLAGIAHGQDVGVIRPAAIWISFRSRAVASVTLSSGRSTLIATLRRCFRSSARRTVAAAADLRLHGVPVRKGRLQMFEEIRHVRAPGRKQGGKINIAENGLKGPSADPQPATRQQPAVPETEDGHEVDPKRGRVGGYGP